MIKRSFLLERNNSTTKKRVLLAMCLLLCFIFVSGYIKGGTVRYKKGGFAAESLGENTVILIRSLDDYREYFGGVRIGKSYDNRFFIINDLIVISVTAGNRIGDIKNISIARRNNNIHVECDVVVSSLTAPGNVLMALEVKKIDIAWAKNISYIINVE